MTMVNAGGLDGRASRGEMGGMSEKNKKEIPLAVRRILASVREEHRPDVEARLEAGRKLAHAFEGALLEEPGLRCEYKGKDETWIAGVGRMPGVSVGFQVSLSSEEPGIFMWRENDGKRKGEAVLVKGLEYDAATKSYVGADPDRAIAPIPGEPIPRKDPLLVLAEAFKEMMTDEPLTILEACAQAAKGGPIFR